MVKKVDIDVLKDLDVLRSLEYDFFWYANSVYVRLFVCMDLRLYSGLTFTQIVFIVRYRTVPCEYHIPAPNIMAKKGNFIKKTL
jgi:hypothetical protein